MAYKGTDELKETAASSAKGLLRAVEMLKGFEETLPVNQRWEIQKLKDKHSVIAEAEEAIKNINLDTSTW